MVGVFFTLTLIGRIRWRSGLFPLFTSGCTKLWNRPYRVSENYIIDKLLIIQLKNWCIEIGQLYCGMYFIRQNTPLIVAANLIFYCTMTNVSSISVILVSITFDSVNEIKPRNVAANRIPTLPWKNGPHLEIWKKSWNLWFLIKSWKKMASLKFFTFVALVWARTMRTLPML